MRKSAMIVPTIPPDGRTVAAYDREVAHVEAVLEEIREELRGGGYDATDEQVLNVAFTKDWLENHERGKLATIEGPAKLLLQDMAAAKVSALAARLDDLRVQVVGAGLVTDEGRIALHLKRGDIESIGGKLRVTSARRSQFIDDQTRRLDDAEAEAYAELYDIVPRLKRLKERGFAVATIVEGRVGRADWQHGVPGVDGLERDVIKFKYQKIR